MNDTSWSDWLPQRLCTVEAFGNPQISLVVQVQFDSALVGARDIIGVVTGLGYEASLLQNDELSAGMSEREKEKRFWRQKVVWSLLFSVPVFLLAMVFSYLPV